MAAYGPRIARASTLPLSDPHRAKLRDLIATHGAAKLGVLLRSAPETLTNAAMLGRFTESTRVRLEDAIDRQTRKEAEERAKEIANFDLAMSALARKLLAAVEEAREEATSDRVLAELVARPLFVALLAELGPHASAKLLEELEGAVLRARGVL